MAFFFPFLPKMNPIEKRGSAREKVQKERIKVFSRPSPKKNLPFSQWHKMSRAKIHFHLTCLPTTILVYIASFLNDFPLFQLGRCSRFLHSLLAAFLQVSKSPSFIITISASTDWLYLRQYSRTSTTRTSVLFSKYSNPRFFCFKNTIFPCLRNATKIVIEEEFGLDPSFQEDGFFQPVNLLEYRVPGMDWLQVFTKEMSIFSRLQFLSVGRRNVLILHPGNFHFENLLHLHLDFRSFEFSYIHTFSCPNLVCFLGPGCKLPPAKTHTSLTTVGIRNVHVLKMDMDNLSHYQLKTLTLCPNTFGFLPFFTNSLNSLRKLAIFDSPARLFRTNLPNFLSFPSCLEVLFVTPSLWTHLIDIKIVVSSLRELTFLDEVEAQKVFLQDLPMLECVRISTNVCIIFCTQTLPSLRHVYVPSLSNIENVANKNIYLNHAIPTYEEGICSWNLSP